jgi:FkbH-like protein
MMLSYREIQEVVNHMPIGVNPKLHVTVLRNITVEPIEPYLRYFSNEIGFEAELRWGDYDAIFQEAVGHSPDLLNTSTNCVIVFAKLEVLSSALSQSFPCLSPEKIEAEVTRILDYVSAVLQGIRQQTQAMILWMGFERPVHPALGIIDAQTSQGQVGTIQRLNGLIQQALQAHENSYFVDLDLSLARVGMANYFDYRYWHIGRAPFTRAALQDIATEIFKYLRVLKGSNKKCLVLDCDNTLWGGIVGEDGLTGIQLSRNSHPGSSFYEFQQEVVNLYHRGILIALCSKNESGDVWNVFHNHPDMVLQESHIACARINWEDKASNLQQIAADLNIGVDSLVFMDDNDFEVNLVRQLLPEVETIHLPVKRSVEYRNILASGGWFDSLVLTEEDRSRGAMYLAERQRKKVKQDFTSISQYHKSLNMVAEFSMPDSFSISRVAQLTLKTNQFNLTTQRYSEADIAMFVDNDTSDVLVLSLKDDFGDYGIVGVCILTYENDQATINSLLMSCRVLGRYVEDAFLHQIFELVQNLGCKVIWGLYSPTPKNTQVATFYTDHGFIEETKGEFCYNLTEMKMFSENRFPGEIVSNLLLRS